MLSQIRRKLRSLANPERAKVSLRFFKTGPGEYGCGDQFLGNTVPDLRKIAKEFRDLPQTETLDLLHSTIHEERLLALLILNSRFQRGNEREQKTIHQLFLKNIRWINNWDLVDCSAPVLVGEYLFEKKKNLLMKFARSRNLWERRIAMISTFPFIKRNSFETALVIAEILINDKEDLIHKASGWMLREIGKRDVGVLETFLQKHAARMPRTMLRYAVEKFDEPKRRRYLNWTA